MVVRHTSHARYDLWYHLAWSTKYRKHIWRSDADKAWIKEMFRAIAKHYDMDIGEIECLSDHVHMTVSAPPRIAPARIPQILKSVSTKLLFEEFPWLKREYWGGEVWIAGYFVRSVGPGLTKEQIEQYVREQSEEI